VRGERGDLRRDRLLLAQREPHDVLHRGEVVAHVVDAGDGHGQARVEQVAHHAHGVVALLQGLGVEVRRQPGQVLPVQVDGDRDVLLRRGELVADLLAQQGQELRLLGHPSRVRP
jgi:hypothetical protein